MLQQTGSPVKTQTDRTVKHAQCQACGRWGRLGTEVHTLTLWQGGHGLVERTWCVDSIRCSARQAKRTDAGEYIYPAPTRRHQKVN